MKDLSRHIEYLLCNHNSVAIPGIGVFTTEDLQATYYAEECLYLPPVRSVRLSTENTDDDGKLENCLVQLHRITRNVAKKWIAEYTQDINQSLMDMGYMDMGTIGRLVMKDGQILFEVCDAGVNTPELYGLDSFHMPKLPVQVHRKQIFKDSTHVTIRLRKTTVHRIMTAAAMLIIALTVILPNYSTFHSLGGHQAQIASTESLKAFFASNPCPIATPLPKQIESIEPIEEANKNTVVCDMVPLSPAIPAKSALENTGLTSEINKNIEQENQESIEENTQMSSITPSNTSSTNTAQEEENHNVSKEEPEELVVQGYCVVMASAITNKGAEHLINKLNKEGFKNAVKHKDNGMLRVLLIGYANEQAARADMAVVRATDSLYSGSWLKHF